MKLVDYSYLEDFGHEIDFHILKGSRRSFFHFFVSIPVYAYQPHVSIELGISQGLRFTLDLGIIHVSKSFLGTHFD
jgi:hypothetical protein